MNEAQLRDHAHHFEELVVRLLKSQYSAAPTFVCVTETSHDGGFDGVLRLDILRTQHVEHYSLVEAKLRSSRELELAAIGKAVVVAFNATANTLYIATNRPFGPQARKHLALFQWKTNLRIVLLDGGVISAWIRRERANLTDFDPALLDYIAEAEPRDRIILEHIDPDDELPIQTHVSTTARLPRYEIESGWDGETLASNELRPSAEPRLDRALPPLIGATRRAAVTRIAGLLESKRGVVLVSGGAGIGKSFVVRHLRHELARRDIASTLVNMTGVTTRRVYFLRLLAALTGVNVEAIAEEEGPDGLHALLSTFSDDVRPSERQAVAAILASKEANPFHDRPDLQIDLITNYLERLAGRIVHPQILFYENLEYSTREVLDLLRRTARRLVTAAVSTVFEARRFGEAGIEREGSTPDEQRLSPEEWGVVLLGLRDAADLEDFEVAPFSDAEAVELIEHHWPGFGRSRAEVIIGRVGHTPFFIESALNWLRATEAVTAVPTASTVANLEVFFEGISPTGISQLFRKQLDLWWKQYEDVFAAASLLDGQLPIDVLAALQPERSSHAGWDAARALVQTRLFELDPTADAIRVTHNLITEELELLFQTRADVYGGHVQRPDYLLSLRRVARVLLPELPTTCSEERVRLKTPLFLAAAGRWSDALQMATEAISTEAKRREWSNVSTLALFGLKAAKYLPSEEERNARRFALLLDLLDAERHRGRLSLDVNRTHVEEAEVRVRTTPLLAGTPAGRSAMMTALLAAADHHYAREEFDLALQAAVDAERTAVNADISIEARAKAFHMHGLALKGLDRREESFRVYAKAVRRMPKVEFLRNEERSNLAAFNLMTKPRLARRFYEEILAARKDEPEYKKLHVLVDVAMAEFLMKDYASARANADVAREIADASKNFLEAARARNILGCCAWEADRVAEADLLFNAGSFAAERTLSKRYLWRIRVNWAGTARELGRDDVAIANATTAERMITAPRKHAIQDVSETPMLLKSRWYAALTAIGAIYLQIEATEYERFLSRVPISSLAVDCPNAARRRYRKAVFGGTTHIHGKRIMITG